ncbi:MAG: putative signal transducing protein [Butyribacter sp.]|uniref:putative signal transducing protein n=1 Tax=Butyribacter TaxID=2822463 RepID=UPI003844E5B9|nr:DUF2007 domain-containing protein [Roseburia hominis]
MKNIYIASNSVEADSVVNKLSQNGINASCRQKENFSVMAGNTEVEFEIFVDDWEADKAKKLLSKKDYTPPMGFEKRRRMAAILSLVFIAAVFIIVIATSL